MSRDPINSSNTTTTTCDLQKPNRGFKIHHTFWGAPRLSLGDNTRVAVITLRCSIFIFFSAKLLILHTSHNGSIFWVASLPLLSERFTNPPDHSDVSPKNICFVWSGAISVLSRPPMDVEIIWCADFPPVSQPGRQSALFLWVFFSAAVICGCVDKTNRTNYSTLEANLKQCCWFRVEKICIAQSRNLQLSRTEHLKYC